MPDFTIKLTDNTILKGNKMYLVGALTKKILKQRYDNGLNAPISANELYSLIEQIVQQNEDDENIRSIIKLPTFRSYMSLVVGDQYVPINSKGNGYYYRQYLDEELSEESTTSPKRVMNKMIERKLYKPCCQYFQEIVGNKTTITANLKPKTGTKYSIPDLSLCEYRSGLVNYEAVELTAVEIKQSPKAVTLDSMMQAFNQKNLCGSALLMYPVAQSDKNKVDENLIELHYLLGVGIGFIVMTDDYFDRYLQGNVDDISLEDVDIEIPYKPRRKPLTAIEKYDYFVLIGQTIFDLDNWQGNWIKKP